MSTSAAPLFVVGTGRCGSTLLSSLLRDHPQVLSISELFSYVTDLGSCIAQAFPAAPLDGREFWRRMAACLPRETLLLRHGLYMPELEYPLGRGRYDAQTGIPALAMTVLPHLDPEPDALFDELGAAMCERGLAAMPDHYRAMFEWLRVRQGRAAWVERSGGSLRIVARLVEAFPEARFVHLVRDGRNTAISMSRHVGFRMAMIGYALLELLGVDPFESDDRSEVDDLPDELAALLPEHFTAEAFWRYDIPPVLCGHYWSGELVRGLAVLRELPPERVMTLRYEHLLADPRASITALDRFLALGPRDDAWLESCVARVGRGRSAWTALPDAEQRELARACAPGFAALAELGLHW